jgi:FMN phosphatase YigB (HAD superfamily)
MTNTASFTSSPTQSLDLVDAVLFDLSGTLLDDGYARHGFAAVTNEMFVRWAIDPRAAVGQITREFRAVSAEVADQRFYLMSDVMRAAFARVISAHGHTATAGDLVALDLLMWSAAIPSAVAASGAVETVMVLRAAGIRTGIVSYADITVFDALLEQTGLAGLTDVEVCSEMARSCKPDPAIFEMAFDAIDIAPQRAMFVGDSVESDVAGGNRVGMRTVLLTAREFAIGGGSNADPLTHPDHRANHLLEVLDLLGLDASAA